MRGIIKEFMNLVGADVNLKTMRTKALRFSLRRLLQFRVSKHEFFSLGKCFSGVVVRDELTQGVNETESLFVGR